jgi:hypothetical protein
MAEQRRLSQAAMDYYGRPQSGSGGVTDYGYYTDPATGRVVQRIEGGGYAEYAPRSDGSYLDNKDQWSHFDQSGNYTQDYAHTDDGLKESLAMFLAAAGGMQFLPGGMFNAGGLSGGIGTSADIGMGQLAPFDMASIPAASTPYGGVAGAAGAGAAVGAGGGGTGTLSTLEAFNPAIPAASTPFSAGGSLLGGLMGPAATAAGALLGSKPQEQSQTSERKLPDYLQGPVVQDLIPRTQGLLAQQMPMAAQYGQQMGQMGQGLLNINPAGNGFDRFTKGRY